MRRRPSVARLRHRPRRLVVALLGTVVLGLAAAGTAYASWYTFLNWVNEPQLSNTYSGQAFMYEVGAEAASTGRGGANVYLGGDYGYEYGSFYTAPAGTPVYTPYGPDDYGKAVAWNDSYSTQKIYGQFYQ